MKLSPIDVAGPEEPSAEAGDNPISRLADGARHVNRIMLAFV
jgi:hypothetical protein